MLVSLKITNYKQDAYLIKGEYKNISFWGLSEVNVNIVARFRSIL